MGSIGNIRRQAAIDELLEQGWLRHLEWLPEVDSTNSLAKRWCTLNPVATPSLFIADQQTAGRGRGGNQWWSPSGCLMLTLAIPTIELPENPALHPQLALVTGLAVAVAVDALLGTTAKSQAQLKWPNDVYLDGRKLAGILIESLQTKLQTTGFAIGIGINTQIDWRDAPVQLLERATCLSSVADRAIDCETVLVELMQKIRDELASWREFPDKWLARWQERCLLTDCVVRLRAGDAGELIGRCEGIDFEGRLLLRTETKLHSLTACEILSWTQVG